MRLQPDSAEQIEQLGSKPKFWFKPAVGDCSWLFKFSRPGTGEDWAEKISAEIADLLDLPHAQVHLAELAGKRGTASPDFVPDGCNLIHGNEILGGHVLGYDPSKRFRHSDHTLSRIVKAFYDIFPEGEERRKALTTLAGYIVFDAIICNTDRHHENWALLRSLTKGEQTAYRIAPTFDHASSLGRELLDQKRALLVKNKRVKDYVVNGNGAIYWNQNDAKGMNPLALAAKAATAYPSYFDPWIKKVKGIDKVALEVLVDSTPESLVSQTARKFTLEMLLCTVTEVGKLPV